MKKKRTRFDGGGGSGPSAGSGNFVAEADDGSEGEASPFVLYTSHYTPHIGNFYIVPVMPIVVLLVCALVASVFAGESSADSTAPFRVDKVRYHIGDAFDDSK